jgi:uncharacterized protein YjbI with pentapeptide repeats
MDLFQGATFNAPVFKGQNLPHALLSKTTIRNADFSYCNLERAKFIGSQITATSFERVVGDGLTFNGAVIEETKFTGARLRGVSFTAAKLKKASFIDAEITDGCFTRIEAPHSNWCNAHAGDYFHVVAIDEQLVRNPPSLFTAADKIECTLDMGAKCSLQKKSQTMAKISNGLKLKSGSAFWLSIIKDVGSINTSTGTRFYAAILPDSDFSSAQFLRCDFDDCDFRNGTMRNTVIVHSRARNAKFGKVNFHGAILDDTDFSGADFSGADLSELRSCNRAVFANCSGLTEGQLRSLAALGGDVGINNYQTTQPEPSK